MKLMIVGPPGSGKGTVAKRLSKDYNLKHISTGDILRQEIEKDTEFGRKIAKIIDNGNFVSDTDIYKIMKPYLSKDFILDGYPRDLNQINLIEEGGVLIDSVIYLNLSFDICVQRILNRKDGRMDDCENVARQRMVNYDKMTKPVVEHYQNKNNLIEIDASRSINEVYDDILKKLNK